MNQLKRGFTLVELLLVVSLLALLGASSFGIGRQYLLRYRHQATVRLFKAQLSTAQTHARAARNASDWGVNIASQEVVLFSGSNFASRDTSQDFSVTFPTGVSISNNEIVFAKNTGIPNSETVFQINSPHGSTTVTINAVGAIQL